MKFNNEFENKKIRVGETKFNEVEKSYISWNNISKQWRRKNRNKKRVFNTNKVYHANTKLL